MGEGSGHTQRATKPVVTGVVLCPLQMSRNRGARGPRVSTPVHRASAQGSWLKSRMNRGPVQAAAHTAPDTAGEGGQGWGGEKEGAGEQQRKLSACRGKEARGDSRWGGSEAAGPGHRAAQTRTRGLTPTPAHRKSGETGRCPRDTPCPPTFFLGLSFRLTRVDGHAGGSHQDTGRELRAGRLLRTPEHHLALPTPLSLSLSSCLLAPFGLHPGDRPQHQELMIPCAYCLEPQVRAGQLVSASRVRCQASVVPIRT